MPRIPAVTCDPDGDIAPRLRLRDDVGGEAERALQHVERGLEEVRAARDFGEGHLCVLAELYYAALGEFDQQAGASAHEDLIARSKLRAREERQASAGALRPRRHLHRFHCRRDLRPSRAACR